MIAKAYGQDPRDVAAWEPEWLSAASTAMAAENGAQVEIEKRQARRSKLKGRMGA